MTDAQMLAALRAHWEIISDALGDARAYRIDDGSDEPSDHEKAAAYVEAAEALGMTPYW